MKNIGFINIGSEIVLDVPIRIDEKFLSNVQTKSISTLDMISKLSFENGIAKLKAYIDHTKGKETVHEMPLTIVFGEKTS